MKYELAIETSGAVGSVSLGKGDQLIDTRAMPPQVRHRVDLMPTIDQLCRDHGLAPDDLGEVYLSIGPGSFTGLRIAVTTAKMLAKVLGAKLVAVPTLDVVALNAPPPEVPPETTSEAPPETTPDVAAITLVVGLNVKRDTVYAGCYRWDGRAWRPRSEPALMDMPALLDRAGRPVWLLGPMWPAMPDSAANGGVTVLPPELATARSEAVWRLGRERAQRGEWSEAVSLLPLYVRPPEAVELWEKRRG